MNRTALSALFLSTAVFAQTASLSPLAGASAAPAAQPAPMNMAAVVVNDAATRTAKVNLVAGQGTANNGLNYNGASKGEKTLTVPLGWTVEVTLTNAGRAPHNMLVLTGSALPTAIDPARVPFPGAVTKVIAPGGAAETTKFTANRPGSYTLLCGVGRHAQNGMYIKLVVTNSVKAATYQ
ncbi:sulfocyanin-like copper-binding protein [Deinococcus altitudinis]|uniref:sulfocyanin-like copper-binding protein n=1 Tax=Deinococcus altitudinis TaxID=468914 RepID=UPI0038926F51